MKKLDFTLPLLALILFTAVIASLPFDSDSAITKVAPYDMSQATMLTVHESQFFIDPAGTIWLGSHIVETELDEQAQAELFYLKEEINIRTTFNGRVSIIAGDNGQF